MGSTVVVYVVLMLSNFTVNLIPSFVEFCTAPVTKGLFSLSLASSARLMRRLIMRAVQIQKCGGPEVLEINNDVPVPQPADQQVQINVKAVGVNPKDTYVRAGTLGIQTDKFPFILGTDAAGIVSAVEKGVENVKTGDRVFCVRALGAYAEYTLAAAEHVWKLPEALSFSQGAGLGVPYFTALRALTSKAHAKAGEKLLVHGASGATGLAACQIAASMKLVVTGTASSADGAELVRKNGAAAVLNHKDPGHMKSLREAGQGTSFDVILEMLANANLELDLDVAAENGRIVVIGSRGSIEIEPRKLMTKEVTVHGMMLSKTPPQEWIELGATICRGLDDGSLRPVVDREYPLAEVAQAHEAVISHTGGSKGKIVLTIE